VASTRHREAVVEKETLTWFVWRHFPGNPDLPSALDLVCRDDTTQDFLHFRFHGYTDYRSMSSNAMVVVRSILSQLGDSVSISTAASRGALHVCRQTSASF